MLSEPPSFIMRNQPSVFSKSKLDWLPSVALTLIATVVPAPETCNCLLGLVVPIPTLPVEVIRIFSEPPARSCKLPALLTAYVFVNRNDFVDEPKL